MQYELGFLGAGNMAESIAGAAAKAGVLSPGQMIASDPSEARCKVFGVMGIEATSDNTGVISQSKQIMLAVKPQLLSAIAENLSQHLRNDQVLISIMAGVTTTGIERALGRPARVVRVMPNTPVLIGCGMAAVAAGRHAQPGDEDLTLQLFEAAGQVVRVDEEDLDAVTSVSGSGPAYLFYLAEAMEAAAIELGLASDASLLVRQTLLGASRLLVESGLPADELRQRVTSRGGTTEAAIKMLDDGKFVATLTDAIKAACQRSKELGK